MFYIFNTSNICVCTADIEPDTDDLSNRGEFCVSSDTKFAIGSIYSPSEKTISLPQTDYSVLARQLRNTMRSKIDTFLGVAATYADDLVSDLQKQDLISDSLLLARWPAVENWPLIPLPTLSNTFTTLCGEFTWEYVNLDGVTQTSTSKSIT